MSKNIPSFEEFCKMGVSPLVKKHYSGSTTKAEDLSDPKDSTEKGNGKADHTETVKADDLGDPKNAKMNESLWDMIFGKPTVKDATSDHMRSHGWSRMGKDEENYIVFQGKKFYQDDIEYDDYHSTKPIPRVEGGKLIIANPQWRE